jgi:hypothetical protein
MYVKLLEQQKKIREEALLLNGSVQTARTALERHELLVQKQFYGSENEYVRIGSEDRNYQVHGLEIVPTLERIDWTEFRFQEVFEDISYKVSAGNKIETTTKDYFMSIRIDKNDTENLNNGNIISFNVEMEKGEIGGYTYYPLGVVRFVAGEVAMPAIDKGFTLIHGDFIQTGTVQADYIRVGSDADTRVSEGETANQIVQENKNVWDQAAINAQNALSNISDMSSDSKITPTEKINLKREFDIATQEKTNVVLTADSIRDNAGNEIPTIVTAKTNLITAYNALNTYVSPLLVDMSVTSDVNSTTLTQKFTDFYDKLNGVYKAIDKHLNVARNFADNVAANGYTEIDGGKITTFILAANKYIQAGTADRNYKLDGTQGLIRTIGSNIYNIFSYVTSGSVEFNGSVTYKDIDLTSYGLTDYIAILTLNSIQIKKSTWFNPQEINGNANITINWEKINNNTLRISYFGPPSKIWSDTNDTDVTIPTVQGGAWSSWYSLFTTSANTSAAKCEFKISDQYLIRSYSYNSPGSRTIKARARNTGDPDVMSSYVWVEIDWGDGTISQTEPFYKADSTILNIFGKVSQTAVNGSNESLYGTIGYVILGY